MDTDTKTEVRAAPWNRGKLLGQKPPLKLKEIWAIRIRCNSRGAPENSRCSTSQLTASYAAAIWSASVSTMWFTEIESPPARL